MKLTMFGIMVSIGTLVLLSIIRSFDVQLFSLGIASIIIQAQLNFQANAKTQFSLASYMAILPLLLVLFNKCYRSKELLVALSVGLAIARIGCYFASCCTGKIVDKNKKENKDMLTIEYDEDYLINKKLNKKNINVYPTIIVEILLQFLIAYIIFKSDYAIVWFGILNAVLLVATSYWRLEIRTGNIAIPVVSLLTVSVIGYLKCGAVQNFKLKTKLSYWMYLISLIAIIITSNDVNVKHAEDKVKELIL